MMEIVTTHLLKNGENMKLKNKRTGEIVDVRMSYREDTAPIVVSETTCDENGQSQGWPYNSLAELNSEWEDYEEPKMSYFINWFGEVSELSGYISNKEIKKLKEIGNYFESEEEAEKAVEKLKAWKRLKDKGFRFGRWQFLDDRSGIWVKGNLVPDIVDELDLLFGGEE